VKTENLAVVQGWADTRRTLSRWQRRPRTVLTPWALGSLLVAIGLLAATWLIAVLSVPDATRLAFPGVTYEAGYHDYAYVLFRNSLVLALHALACVAGFMAGSSLPIVAEGYSGVWRWVHEKAGPLAIGFVVAATLFSLCTQAYILGSQASTLANQLDLTEGELILGISAHAIPELFALFLPLAAWTMAPRRGRWEELLAATFVTVAVAIPLLLGAAAIEVWVSPRILIELAA
jgi:zinc transporter ZupT